MAASDVLTIVLEEQERARGIIAGLGPCRVVVSRATTMYGMFSVDRRGRDMEIRVSRHIRDEEQVRETARHELAHQAAWQRYEHLGHGPLWQTLAVYLGCAPVSCGGLGMDEDVVRARWRYVVTCLECGLVTARQKRSKLVRAPWRYACARCSGKLRVSELA